MIRHLSPLFAHSTVAYYQCLLLHRIANQWYDSPFIRLKPPESETHSALSYPPHLSLLSAKFILLLNPRGTLYFLAFFISSGIGTYVKIFPSIDFRASSGRSRLFSIPLTFLQNVIFRLLVSTRLSLMQPRYLHSCLNFGPTRRFLTRITSRLVSAQSFEGLFLIRTNIGCPATCGGWKYRRLQRTLSPNP